MDEVWINYNGLELIVTGRFERGRRGIRTFSSGDPGFPDDPDEFYIERVLDVDGKDITQYLSGEELEMITEKVLEKYEDE